MNENYERSVAAEDQEGKDLEKMEVGATLEATTESGRTYIIEKRTDGFYISGHPRYCPEPTKAEIGSRVGNEMIRPNFIGNGAHLEFTIEGETPVITTDIKEVKER
jgi:hypothetical protein